MKKIMVCYDGTEAAKNALRLAREHAKAFNAEVVVVTSLAKGDPDNQDQINEAKKGLEYAQSVLNTKGVSCKTDLLIRGMGTGEDLVQFARDNNFDLVIIGIVKKSKVGKILFGSTAQFLILNAPCPVLTVR